MLTYSGSDVNVGVVKNTAEKRWGMNDIKLLNLMGHLV
jgi:hypothetical protein